MGSLTAQPEVQADHLFLQWAQNLQELGYSISIHGHLDCRISDWRAACHRSPQEPVILVTRNSDDVPFDLRGLRLHRTVCAARVRVLKLPKKQEQLIPSARPRCLKTISTSRSRKLPGAIPTCRADGMGARNGGAAVVGFVGSLWATAGGVGPSSAPSGDHLLSKSTNVPLTSYRLGACPCADSPAPATVQLFGHIDRHLGQPQSFGCQPPWLHRGDHRLVIAKICARPVLSACSWAPPKQ
jgi:hypothetical protein